jgi:CheY-like chemotaxis protein
VLIAEDNPINQKVASHLLERLGYGTSVAENGIEALEFLRQDHFDLLLLDIQMPVMDGYETCRAIRASEEPWANIPIVALTANALPEVRDRCFNLGMNDFLTKPVTKDRLAATVQKNLMNCHSECSVDSSDRDSVGSPLS